jgi:leucyl/phenylalanyl-tRNA--protein transferase
MRSDGQPSRIFPPAESADENGLVAVGGRLDAGWLIDGYSHGIFPWPIGNRLAWWSPDPRAVLEFDRFHVSRSLAKTCRQDRFQLTLDRDFEGVLAGCATAQDRKFGTWLNPAMRAAYLRLHRAGVAHSVEAWEGSHLAGGTYGVCLGAYFSAESMFYRVRDASKVALVYLVEHLRERGGELLDIQILNAHTERLGGSEISRAEFLARLNRALGRPSPFD